MVLLPLVPRVTGLSVHDAQALLREQGFHTRVVETGGLVINQRPARGQLALGATAHHPNAGIVTLDT